MRRLSVILLVLILNLTFLSPLFAKKRRRLPQNSAPFPCLPTDIHLNDVVDIVRTGTSEKKITVRDRLKELKASCQTGKLMAKGKEVKFYPLIGCWGNPPADYLELLQNQTKELAELNKKYTVITITCNPNGAQID